MGRKPSIRGVTFDSTSARAMWRKLKWELDQIKRPNLDRESLSHAALNFASTAWHLHEWVWDAIKGNHALLLELSKAAEVAPQKFDKDEFGKWVARSNSDVGLCRIVATSVKHVSAELEPDDPRSVEAVVSATSTQVATVDDIQNWDLLDDVDRLTFTIWKLKLTVDGKKFDLIEAYERVVQFWTHFIWDNNIDPGDSAL